jgi:hypothetical protein
MSVTLDLSRRPAPRPEIQRLTGLSVPALRAELEALGLDPVSYTHLTLPTKA